MALPSHSCGFSANAEPESSDTFVYAGSLRLRSYRIHRFFRDRVREADDHDAGVARAARLTHSIAARSSVAVVFAGLAAGDAAA